MKAEVLAAPFVAAFQVLGETFWSRAREGCREDRDYSIVTIDNSSITLSPTSNPMNSFLRFHIFPIRARYSYSTLHLLAVDT